MEQPGLLDLSTPLAVRCRSPSVAQHRGIVLVVDDELMTRHVLGGWLSKAGYTVKAAADGREAMEVVSRMVPDLIVLDLMMPAMTGFEVLGALRTNKDWSDIPVIVLTATMGYSAGHLDVDAVLYKPFDAVDVEDAILVALESSRKKREKR